MSSLVYSHLDFFLFLLACRYVEEKNIKSKIVDVQPCVGYSFLVEMEEKDTLGTFLKGYLKGLFKIFFRIFSAFGRDTAQSLIPMGLEQRGLKTKRPMIVFFI
jgi:hypothetical protein